MIIFGSGGGGKGGGGGSGGTPTEHKNTLRNRTIIQLLDVVSEGEIEGFVNGEESIFFGDTPYKNSDGTYNYPNVSWVFTPGTRDQAALSGIPAATNEISVGMVIKKANPYEFTVNNLDTDIIRVRLGIPNLSRQDLTSGDLVGATLQYRIDARSLPSGAWVPVAVGRTRSQVSPGTAAFTGAFQVDVSVSANCAAYRQWFSIGRESTREATVYLASNVTLEKRINGGAWTVVGVKKVGGSANGSSYSQLRSQSVSSAGTPTAQFSFTCNPGDTVEVRGLVSQAQAAPAGKTLIQSASLRSVATYRTIADPVVTLKDKCVSRYERSHSFDPKVTVGDGPWQVRVTRITDDSTSSYLQNNLEIAGYSEINTEKFRYPYTAMVGLEVDAEQFSSVPVRGYHMRYMIVNVPSNYDPLTRIYTGAWDGTFKRAWTNCPPWIFYDLATSKRFGLGNRIKPEMLDKATLYKIGQYCDELVPDGYGGAEPRFTCNVFLQEQQEAAKLLTDLASVFAGMAFYSADRIRVVQDSPRDPGYLFTNSNVVDGVFEYATVDEQTRFNAVKVSWNNPTDMFRQKVEYVSDPVLVRDLGYVRDTETVAFGCTSRAQARRAGRHLLYVNYYGKFVSFKVGSEGAIPAPGMVVLVQDSMKAGERRHGRLQAIDGAVVDMDQAINVPVGSTMTVIDSTAGLQSRTVTSVSGKQVTLDSAYNPQPKLDTLYTVAATDSQPQKYMVLSVSEDDKHEYSITAMLHLDSKYDYIEDDADLVMPDISNTSLALSAPPAPTNLAISDTLYYGPGGTLKSKIMLSWTPPEPVYGVRFFQVRYRKQDSTWVDLPQSASPSADILDVTDGMPYEIQVLSVNTLGLTTTEVGTSSYTPLGLRATPANVTGFVADIDPQLGTLLRWEPVADLDVDYYELREGASWGAGTPVTRVKATEYRAGFALSRTLWIKATDSTGNESETAATLTLSLSAAPAQTVYSALVGKTLTLSWGGAQGAFNTAYAEISAPGFTTQTVKGSAFTLDVDWLGSKVFTVRLVDLGGNAGASATKGVTITAPTAPTVTAAFEGDSAVLGWGAVTGSLPTALYSVRRNGTVIATIQGTRWSQKVDWAGSVTYSVAAVDQNGNVGAYGSVSVAVTNPPAPTVSGDIAGKVLGLTWTAVQGSLPIAEYEISAAGITTQRVKGTSLNIDVDWFGSKTFSVKAVDTAGNFGAVGQYASTVIASAAPAVTSSFVGDGVVLRWSAIAGTLPTEVYQISKAGVVVATIQGTSWSQKVDWAGSKLFEVAAVDVNGNVGAKGSVSPAVTVPTAPAVQQEVIDNNVLLRWGDAQQTLPVATYEVRRGADWATAKVVGKTLSRFSALFESVAGTFTYLVAAYDTAGNLGAVGSVAAIVAQPPDYSLQLDFNSTLGGTLSNAKLEGSEVLMPVNLTETIAQHFDTRSWASAQAQVNAGFPIFIQPTPSPGYYEETLDYGTVLASTKVTVTPTLVTLAGTPTVQVTISVRDSLASPWINYPDQSSVYATNFRYVKVKVQVSGADGKALVSLSALNIRLDSKLKNDAGTATAVSTDAGGTEVFFNTDFVDIWSITVTPKGTTPVTAIYDFADVPNPTSFKVLLFNSAGARVSGDVSWSIKGV